ncbi:MAG: ribosomal-protein-alanine N-acetyltransferase [Verrucomicrobiales bacterium]
MIRSAPEPGSVPLIGRRLVLRPLTSDDYAQWREVRMVNDEWLTKWEPQRIAGQPDLVQSRQAFSSRCAARQRERQLGTGYGFGIFVGDYLAGEMNVSAIQRGPFQNAYVGYWIDQRHAGQEYTPEALVVAMQFAFGELRLHRLQIAIIPRNRPSRRVVEKLGIRLEGMAERYLEINGNWEDHLRYAITTEEWQERKTELSAWL